MLDALQACDFFVMDVDFLHTKDLVIVEDFILIHIDGSVQHVVAEILIREVLLIDFYLVVKSLLWQWIDRAFIDGLVLLHLRRLHIEFRLCTHIHENIS